MVRTAIQELQTEIPQVNCISGCCDCWRGFLGVESEPPESPANFIAQKCASKHLEDSKCSIYPVHPIICRLFGAADDPGFWCPHGVMAEHPLTADDTIKILMEWMNLSNHSEWVLESGAPDAVRFAKWMVAEAARMFRVWHAFRQDQIDREMLFRKAASIRARMAHCLDQYTDSQDREVATSAKGLLKHWDGLFTFLGVQGVEPTNNLAEQGIRPAVQWPKNCYGNQSEEGELLTSRLLTVTRTCLLQGKNPLDFIVDSILAYRAGTAQPSLLPGTL